MASGVKHTGKTVGAAKAVPARSHAQTSSKQADGSAVKATDAATKTAKPSGTTKTAATTAKSSATAKPSPRALPIRSSPVSTAPSLRSKLTTLKTSAKPVARTPAAARANPNPKKPPFARNPVLQELEPRLLMSADLNPLAHDTLVATPALAGAEFRNIADTGSPAVVTSGAVAPIQRTNELVFVDTATPDYQKLIDSMRESALTQGRNLEFVLIDADKDGIRKITDTLAQKSNLDAIHIISHAEDGAVQLGSTALDFETLVKRAAAVKKWGSALTENGDILFYGCDLAASEKGQSLVDAIARLTGADVAASEDLTGSATKGGDWQLEFKTGTIETDVAVSAAEQADYGSVLAAIAQGAETRANSTTANPQFIEEGAQKQVAVAGDGSYVVTWVSQGQDGSGTGVYARRFNANGTAINAGDVLVNQTTLNDQREPAVATDINGNFVVMWDSWNGTDYDVYARRFNAAGTALGNEFQVNTTTLGDQRQGGIAMAPDGRFVIGWASEAGQDGSGAGAYLRLYNAAGTALTGEIRANATTAGNQYFDSIAMDASGNVVMVGSGDNIDGNGTGIYGQRFDSSGNRLGNQFIVNTATTGDQSYGSVAMATNGQFVVTFTNYNAIGADIYMQRYNADGTTAGGNTLVNNTTAGNQEYSSAAMDMNGNFTVTWTSPDAAGQGIFKKDYNANGTVNAAAATDIAVNVTTAGAQVPSSIGMNPWGEYVIAWDGNGTVAGNVDADGVFFQRYVTNLIVDTTNDLSNGTVTSIANLLANKGDGLISLREAIQATNATADAGGPDRIYFRIGGPAASGVQTINVGQASGNNALPAVLAGQAVFIDGTTQPGFTLTPVLTPVIELNGTNVTAGGAGTRDGLRFAGAGSTVRGLIIDRFTSDGIQVDGNNTTIQGNYIGTNAAGSAAAANGTGINVNAGTGVTIGGTTAATRNLISGNSADGIFVNATDNHVIQGNLIGTNIGATAGVANGRDGIRLSGDVDTSTVGGTATGAANTIAFNTGIGINILAAGGDQNPIRANSIYGNTGLAIDLQPVGQTANVAGDADTGANENQNFPVISNAYVSGGFVTITAHFNNTDASRTRPNSTYVIDFFANPGNTREGRTYLGSGPAVTDVNGDATFTFSYAFPGAYVAGTATVTATATCTASGTATDVGNTSEFSPAVLTAVPGALRTIAGIVYLDVDGDADVTDAGTLRAAGATVRLYQDAGTLGTIDGADGALIATAITDASGNYQFNGIAAGRYWVAVDSRTVTSGTGFNTGSSIGDVWAEQTYAVDGVSGTTVVAGIASRYGGRVATTSDVATTLANSEHVEWADANAGNVTAHDFGFSFNAVTNLLRTGAAGDTDADLTANRTIQGSLYQFIQNADAITGANVMRFVPAVGTNAAGGGGAWWQLTLTGALPQITDAFTTIDGTAYDSTLRGAAQDAAPLNTNTGTLGYVGGVGLGADLIAGTADDPTLAGVQKTELEITEAAAATINQGIDIQANNATVRRISIHGFGNDVPSAGSIFVEADIRVGAELGPNTGINWTGTLIEDNLIGIGPSSLANPGPPFQSVNGILVVGADSGTIQRNLVAYVGHMGMLVTHNGDGWTITQNDVRENAWDAVTHDAIAVSNWAGGATISNNYVFNNWGQGFDGYQSTGNNTLLNNTFASNGRGTTENSGARLYGTNNVFQYNLVQNNNGDGVLVARQEAGVAGTPSTGNLISKNSFSGNGGNAIDLNSAGSNQNLGDGITLNDGTTDVNAGNIGIDYPVITSANKSGANTTVNGTAFAGVTSVEVYKALAGTGDTSGGFNYGEGQQYLGTAAVVAGAWSISVTGLAVGDFVSAIGITGANNTSEFGRNVAVTGTISGTIYNDVNGDAAVSGVEGVFANATVKLYLDNGDGIINAGDTLQATATTNASGVYTFSGVANGTYYVVVDSKTLTASGYNGAFGINDVWADQTYAVANAANNTAGTTFTALSGALYGGRSAATSDNAAAITSAEHVTKVVVAGAGVAGVDSGFSFSAIVNIRGDTADDDGGATGRMQQGSLRQFILNSNAISGTQTANFSIGTGAVTITEASLLPSFTDTVVIDGTTQESWVAAPIVEITGPSTGTDGLYLDTGSGGSTIKGLILNNFNRAIALYSSNNLVTGNYLGTNAAGTAAKANVAGVWMNSNNNTVGGTSAAERNILSGNILDGVQINGSVGATGNVIIGNYIGLDVTGTLDLGNTNQGVAMYRGAKNNTVGGTAPGTANVISGNNGEGVRLIDAGTTGNVVIGNLIGTNAAGTGAIGNTIGVAIRDGASGNTIGGTAASTRNVISGNRTAGSPNPDNGTGLLISDAGSAGNVVQGNYIGTNTAGAVAAGFGNGTYGVQFQAGVNGNTVGGTAAGAGNIIAGNNGIGVGLQTAAQQDGILGNSIFQNTGLGIDLDLDGVTANDGATNVAKANIGMDKPVFTLVGLSGTTLTVAGYVGSSSAPSATFAGARVEILKADASGQGKTYLGFLTTDATGHFAGSLTVGGVVVGDKLTATATDAANDTSEFGATASVLAGFTVSGTIYNDVSADSSVSVGEGTFSGVTIELYQDTNGNNTPDAVDILVATTTTGAGGAYSFAAPPNGTYWVVVDSKTIGAAVYNAGKSIADVWADQSYGVTGAMNGAASFLLGPGALYGGKSPIVSDNASALATSEHVTKVTISGSSVGSIDSGFSFNVVDNVRGDATDDDGGATGRMQQGSLRQFILNANAITGANVMRFVPGSAPNVVTGVYNDDANFGNDGGDDWWQITVSTALPAITDSAGTTIDGTAYSRFDGVTLANTNTGTVGYVGAVGLGADGIAGTGDDPAALSGVIKPELEIREVVVGDVDIGLEVRANNVTIRAISIHGFGTPGDIFSDGDIVVGHNFGSDVGENLTGILIEDNVIGSGPAALANPGDASVSGIAVFGADGGTIRRNAIAWTGDFGIFLTSNADGWTVTRNDIRDNGQADSSHDGIDIGNLSGGAIVTENYFFSNEGVGVDSYRSDGSNTIRDNTIDANAAVGGTETAGVRLFGTGSTVSQNVIRNNTGAGVLVVRQQGSVTNTPATGNRITRNSFSNNTGNAIDLNDAAGDNNLGDGITLNDGGTNANAGNIGVDFPVISSAGKSGSTTTDHRHRRYRRHLGRGLSRRRRLGRRERRRTTTARACSTSGPQRSSPARGR